MKIFINTGSTFKGGAVQAANSYIHEFRNFKEHEYIVVLGQLLAKLVDPKDFPSNFTFYYLDYRPATRVFSLKDQAADLKKWEQKHQPDIVISLGGPAYWRPKAHHIVRYALPHYIYPESPFLKQLPLVKRYKRKLKGMVLRRFFRKEADSFIVQTDDVNKRLRKWLKKDDVYTITNTASRYYYEFESGIERLPAKEDGEIRLVLLSAHYPHKNFEIINAVSDLLDQANYDKIKFVVTLPEEDFKGVFSESAMKRVYNVGALKPSECPALYAECDFVFLPTLLECFSATYVEGMIMKKPILTSDLPFATCICEDAAVFFDPIDAKDIFNKLTTILNSPKKQKELIEKGQARLKYFKTAEERAKKLLDRCSEMLNKQQ